jgi:hypothetical protein
MIGPWHTGQTFIHKRLARLPDKKFKGVRKVLNQTPSLMLIDAFAG